MSIAIGTTLMLLNIASAAFQLWLPNGNRYLLAANAFVAGSALSTLVRQIIRHGAGL